MFSFFVPTCYLDDFMPLIPPENIRKLEVLCFEGVKKDTSGMVWVDKTHEKPYDFLFSEYPLRKGAF